VNEVTPGFERFLRHAQLYGADLVLETAESLLAERELARLRVEVDALDRRRPRYGPRRRRSETETMLAAVAMREEGFVIGYIAEKLGVTEKTVKELLARHRRESASQQAQNQGLDRRARPPKTASLSGENASETAQTGNYLQKPRQPQSERATAAPPEGFPKESDKAEGAGGGG
jgi:hypothetical protein